MNIMETSEARRGDQRNSGTARRRLRRGMLAALLLAGVGLARAGAGAAPPAHAAGPLPGTVVAWGCGGGLDFGQCSVPAGLSGVTAIAAGDYHSLALKSDGTVVAWGCQGYDYGQCSVPAGLSNVTAIAAGPFDSLAIKSDGTVVAWGDDTYGQTDVPAGLGGVTAIAAGAFHGLALVAPATVTLGNLSQQYDGTAKAASATIDNAFCGPVSLSYSQNGTPVSAPTNAGSYAVQASLGNSSCAIGTGGTGTLVIGTAPLTIAANNQSMTYGGAVPPFTVSYSGLVGGDTSSVVSGLSCGATDGSGQPVSSSTPAGSYAITCSGSTAANYSISYQPGILTIAPAPLTITAASPSVVYDGTVPAIGPTYNGFVNGDSSASLTTAPTCASTAPAGGAAGTYATSCTGAVDPNYSISYQGGSLTITQAPQAIAFAPLPNHALGDAPFTVGATGGASGNPVTFTAGPSAVCTAGGTNGATITLVGTGTCTITASQAGNQNYQAAPSVAQSFTVSAAPLTLALGVSSSPAGPVTTGSTVTATLTLGNHTAQAQTVKLKVTLTYTGGHSYLSVTVSLKPTLSAGQTLNQYARFTIGKLFPRGTYTLSATATDGSGDTATSSAALTVS
ncbi:MAG TPA: MBG domain-containing protein [Chloroflexota bacterium]|nr:MBG domain-containing protein [Chloroflexota bacterium]